MALRNIVYLSVEQYTELKANGSITVDGQTIVYGEDDVYVTPDETAEQIGDLQAELATQGAKITTLQSAVNNMKLEMFPVDSRYVQFPDEPTPAARFGGTWQLDEAAMDKFLVGAGNLYALGSTGGSADAVVVKHSHSVNSKHSVGTGSYSPYFPWSGEGGTESAVGTTETGEDGTNKNLPPYLAVNIWKRTA